MQPKSPAVAILSCTASEPEGCELVVRGLLRGVGTCVPSLCEMWAWGLSCLLVCYMPLAVDFWTRVVERAYGAVCRGESIAHTYRIPRRGVSDYRRPVGRGRVTVSLYLVQVTLSPGDPVSVKATSYHVPHHLRRVRQSPRRRRRGTTPVRAVRHGARATPTPGNSRIIS